MLELRHISNKRLGQIQMLMKSSIPETNMNNNSKEMMIRQGLGNTVGVDHLIRPSQSEQLVSQPMGSQLLQQMTRF